MSRICKDFRRRFDTGPGLFCLENTIFIRLDPARLLGTGLIRASDLELLAVTMRPMIPPPRLVARWRASTGSLYSIATRQAAINALFAARYISLSLLKARMANASQDGLLWRQNASFFT